MTGPLVEFFARGTPVAQPRPRVRVTRNGALGVCNPETAKVWKETVAWAARAAWRGAPLEGALEVDVVFVLPRPRSHCRRDGSVRPGAPLWPTSKPDRDNLDKAVLDACNGVLWIDDAQVVGGLVAKKYVDEAEPIPGVVLTVRRPS